MQRKLASFKHILFPDTGCPVTGNMLGALILFNNIIPVLHPSCFAILFLLRLIAV